MAKTLFFIKVILILITVFDGISNGEGFRVIEKDYLSTTTDSTNSANKTVSTNRTSEYSNSVQIVWNQTKEEENKSKEQFIGDIALKLTIFLYSCLAIAYLCDEYFVSSLEYLGEVFNLPPDITGAILIPIGTSGPEIFSSAISVFFTSNDIGTGAIIGSSVFNLLAIPAACGIAVKYFIGKPLKLEAMPILRDLLFYILSIIVLILVIKDNRVDLMDSSLLTLLFVIYVGVMIYNAKMSMKNNDNLLDIKTNKLDTIERSETAPLLNDKTIILLEQMAANCNNSVDFGYIPKHNYKSGYEEIVSKKSQQLYENEGNESGLMNNCFLSLILSPVYVLFWITMPKRWLGFTFVISIIWLTGLSYCTVWSISGFSDSLSIPPTVSGMTLLAAGSAVPDLVTSVIVIRKHGLASMGMCAAIASNIFAIVVGLGLPWLLKCLILLVNSNGDYGMAFITIDSNALPYTSCLLLIIIFALLLTLRLCGWKLFTKFSLICALIHLIFMGASISLELFVSS